MDPEFDTTELEGVRKLIDHTLTDDVLPDDTLLLDVYAGEAVRFVSERTSNTDAYARRAAVLHIAVLVIPSVPQIISHSQAGHSTTVQAVNWEARMRQLEEMRDAAIATSERLNPTTVGTAYAELVNMQHFDLGRANQGLL